MNMKVYFKDCSTYGLVIGLKFIIRQITMFHAGVNEHDSLFIKYEISHEIFAFGTSYFYIQNIYTGKSRLK